MYYDFAAELFLVFDISSRTFPRAFQVHDNIDHLLGLWTACGNDKRDAQLSRKKKILLRTYPLCVMNFRAMSVAV